MPISLPITGSDESGEDRVTFLERYLKKARAEDITYSDVDAFLQQGIEEQQNLEYKPRGMLVRQDDSIKCEVFNGDVGTVTSIDLEEQEVIVQFANERVVSYN